MVPSPKFQYHPVASVERSAKFTSKGFVPDVGVPVKFATGLVVTWTVFSIELVPDALVTVRLTV